MALRRWLRVAGPLVLAALVAIALLPPRTPTRGTVVFGMLIGPGYLSNQPQRSQFASDVQSARQTQAWRLRRALTADSIVRAARGSRALRSRDGLVTLVYERPLTADSARAWLDAASRELALYPAGHGPRVPVVVALLSDTLRDRPENRGGANWGVQDLVDQVASTGSCVVTVNLTRRERWLQPDVAHDQAGHAVTRILGGCALYARFGPPGAGVLRWVEAGLTDWSWLAPITLQLQDARRRVLKFDLRRGGEDDEPFWYGRVGWLEVGCLEGDPALCQRMAGLGTGPGSQDTYTQYYFRSLPRGRLMAYLLGTGTPEQFEAFWRSALPPADAFAAAYGRPAGMLMMATLRHWYTVSARPSPWGGTREVLAGLVWAVLAGAVSLAAGRRWKAEV